MREHQVLGLTIIAVLLIGALFLAGWLQGRQERRRREEKTRLVQLPGNQFTSAIWAAQGAVTELQQAVLTGSSERMYAALARVRKTGYTLTEQLEAREEEARLKAYARAHADVTVTESNRLAGEPQHRPGRHNEQQRGR